MTQQTISRDMALRIGLAVRVLPGVDARRLVQVLADKLGRPLTEERLGKVTVDHLKAGFAGADGEGDSEEADIDTAYLKLAVRYLWGEEVDGPELPVAQAYVEGDMPGSIRVAVASAGGDNVDGHFGSCPRFLVYQVNPEEVRLIDVRGAEGADSAEDKNAFRAELIGDCHIAYVQSVGGPAAAKIVRAGVHPVKVPDGGSAPDVLAQLQTVMAGTPPPWLAKIVGVPAEQRVRFAAGEQE